MKAWWKCDLNHEWQALICSRTSYGKNGCPVCNGKKVWEGNVLSLNYPQIVLEWHPTKNGDISPNDISKGSHRRIWWQCILGHEWQSYVKARVAGYNCPYCSNQLPCKENNLLSLFPEIAKEFHPTKNGLLIPQKIVSGSNKKMFWACSKCGFEWASSVISRTGNSHTGCPLCNSSKGEKAVINYLKSNKFIFKHQWRPKKNRFWFDFVVRYNGKFQVIEYQGEQHYFPVSFGTQSEEKKIKMFSKVQENDKKKVEFAKDHNMPFLRIPYWDLHRVDEIIADFFAGSKPKLTIPPQKVLDYAYFQFHETKILQFSI